MSDENDFTRKNLTSNLLNQKQYNNYPNLDEDKDFDDQFLEIASDSDEDEEYINSTKNKNSKNENYNNNSSSTANQNGLSNKNKNNKNDYGDLSEEDTHNIVNENIDESVREEIEEEYEAEQDGETNNREKEARCAYCGITNLAHLVKCNEKDCQRWFCDGRLDEFSASHIVFHLTKSKHKEIYLNENSPIGEMVLECYSCGCKNIFLLGFLESREGDTGIILCREPCLSQCKIVEDKFEKTRWVPLIKDKKLLEWIVPALSDTDMKICNRVNIRSMSKMEEKWVKEKLQVSEEKPKFLGNWLKAVKLCYNDGQDYLETFEPLISAEEEYDRKLKESQKKHGINVVFYKANKRFVAKFNYPREDNEIKLVPGDELKIHDPANTFSVRGFIVKIEIDDEVHLELDKSDRILLNGIFTIEFVWKGTYFKRMLDGLYTLVNDESSLSSYLYYKILGHNLEEKKFNYNIPKDLSVKGLPEMNYFQTLGVKKALLTPLFLIQGPPGTGKTVTSAAIVYHMANLKVGKVLVCAPSNIAADQLSEKISKTGLKVIRLCAKSRESISTRVEHLSLHNQIKSLYANSKETKRLCELMKMKEEGELKKDDYENYKKLKTKAENEVLNQAEVVVTTCIASFDKRLNNFRFPMVLVDEATQSCEGECLLPLLRGAKHVILVGDHCQLGPVVLCKNAAKAGLKMSLFERLIKLKIKPHMLQVQYRMHPMLSEFPSNTFYSGNLQNGVSADERIHYSVNFNWPNANKPMFFYHITGTEEFSASGTSYLNRKEAEFIEKCVTALLKSSVKPEQIGIITPYEGQRSYIVTHMLKNGSVNQNLYKEIEVASVDSFQGREKDYIILSCVRSNDHNGIGFLNDPRRLNVALTRARYGIIIVGNANSLSKHQLWNNLLYHFKSHGLLVEGGLNNFKEYLLVLRNPVRFIPEKQCFETQLNTEEVLANADFENENNEDEKEEKGENKTNDKYDEMLNDATVSRFSDFGYTNDKDSIEHHKKVKDTLKNKPIKLSNEISQNKYDMLIANFNMNTQMPQNKFISPNNTVMALNNMIQNNNFAFQNNPKLINNPMMNNFNMMNLPNIPNMGNMPPMNSNFIGNIPTPMVNQFNPINGINPIPQMNPQFNQINNNMMNPKLYYNHSNFVFKDYYRNLNNEKKFVMQAEF